MKWTASSFLENRVFDHRLVKDNLLDKWNIDTDSFRQRSDYRQFLESYPWTSSGVEQITESPIPIKIGSYMQASRPHEWRPTMGYDSFQTSHQIDPTMTHQLMGSTYTPTGVAVQPLTFPNLVTGFDRNPNHASRAALYTRYTPQEWQKSCNSIYNESSTNRNHSERLRSDAVRLMRLTDDKTSQGQRDAGRRLGERINDITFWRNELNAELEKLISEMEALQDVKRKATKALQDLDPPLQIAQECLYHREGRLSVEKTHDLAEKNLLGEVDNLRKCQEKMKMFLDRICKQLADCRAAQFALEDDLVHKESALGIDATCHQLSNYSPGINYFSGIERFDSTVSTAETWSGASNQRINRSQTERSKSTQLRSDTETLINSVATAVWNCWTSSNNSLNQRASEMSDAKSKVQMHLHQVQQEIFDIERNIDLLRKAIQDKSNPLKVAQTRLEARSHREGLEQCKDFAQMRLVQEVHELQEVVNDLHRKLQQAENQHQFLLKTRSNLEMDLKNKVNALFIDREKCLGLRRSFPVDTLIKY